MILIVNIAFTVIAIGVAFFILSLCLFLIIATYKLLFNK